MSISQVKQLDSNFEAFDRAIPKNWSIKKQMSHQQSALQMSTNPLMQQRAAHRGSMLEPQISDYNNLDADLNGDLSSQLERFGYKQSRQNVIAKRNYNGNHSSMGLSSSRNQGKRIAASQQSQDLNEDSVLQHQTDCKIENKLRLKQVKNLEELIQFKIATVSEKMNINGSLVHPESQLKSLHALRQVIDPLLTSKVYPGAVTKSKNRAGNNTDMSSHSLPGLDHRTNNVSHDQQQEQDMLMQENEETVDTKPENRGSKGKNTISMSDTGTILIEKKTVGQQIEELLQLDETDPIRKLQLYFKQGPYGHDYTDDGVRVPKKYKAPKHKNFVMQRYEDKGQRANLRLAAAHSRQAMKERAVSYQGPMTGANENNRDYHEQYASAGDENQLASNSNITKNRNYQQQQSTYQQQKQSNYRNSYSSQGGSQKGLLSQASRQSSEKKIHLEANFLGQLKQLQDMLKFNMLGGNSTNELDSLEKTEEALGSGTSQVNLPKVLNAAGQQLQQQKESSEEMLVNYQQMPDLIQKYRDLRVKPKNMQLLIPKSGQQNSDDLRGATSTKDDGQYNQKSHETIGEVRSDAVSDSIMNTLDQQEEPEVADGDRLQADLLKNVDDSDNEDLVLEQLVLKAEEIQKQLQYDTDTQLNLSEQQLKQQQSQKIKQLMQLQLKELNNLSQLTEQQRAILLEGTEVNARKISVLSKFATTQRKDYVQYNEKQLHVYQLLNGKNESQKRIELVKERRRVYQSGNQIRQKTADHPNPNSHYKSQKRQQQQFMNNQSYKNKQKIPFSSKKFAEDLQRASDLAEGQKRKQINMQHVKLPKIDHDQSFKSIQQAMMQVEQEEYFEQPPQSQSVENIIEPVVPKLTASLRYKSQIQDKNSKIYTAARNNKPNYSSNIQLLKQNNDSLGQDYPHQNYQDAMELTGKKNSAGGIQIAAAPHNNKSLTQNIRDSTGQLYQLQPQQLINQKSKINDNSTVLTSQGSGKQSLLGMGGISRMVEHQHYHDKSYQQEFNQTELLTSEQFKIDLKLSSHKDSEQLKRYLQQPQTRHVYNSTEERPNEQVEEENAKILDQMHSSEKLDSINQYSNHKDDENEVRDVQDDNSYTARTQIHLKNLKNLGSSQEQSGVESQHLQSIQQPSENTEITVLDQKEKNAVSQSMGNMNQMFVSKPKSVDDLSNVQQLHEQPTSSLERSLEDEHQDDYFQEPLQTDYKKDTIASNQHFQILSVEQQTTEQLNESEQPNGINSVPVLNNESQQQIEEYSASLIQDQTQGRPTVRLEGDITPTNGGKEEVQKLIHEAEIPQHIEIRHSSVKQINQQNGITTVDQGANVNMMFSPDDIDSNILAINKDLSFQGGSKRQQFQQLPPAKHAMLLKQNHLRTSKTQNGYETANETVDPKSFAFLKDLAESMQQQIRLRSSKNSFNAKRFKRFPRFSIYLQKDKNTNHMDHNFISLNNKMIQFLAQQDPDQKGSRKEQDNYYPEQIIEEIPSTDNNQNNDEQSSENNFSTQMLQKNTTSSMKNIIDNKSVKKISEQQIEHNTLQGELNTLEVGITGTATQNDAIQGSSFMTEKQAVDQTVNQTQVEVNDQQKIQTQQPNPELQQNQEQLSQRQYSQQVEYQGQVGVLQHQRNSSTKVIDPFDKVLLLKNIDNAILTSFRTLTRANNVISHTLKVIHNKFAPKALSRHVMNTYKKAHNNLYPVSEVESYDGYFSDDSQNQQIVVKEREPTAGLIISNPLSAAMLSSRGKVEGFEIDLGPQDSVISSIEMQISPQPFLNKNQNKSNIIIDQNALDSRKKRQILQQMQYKDIPQQIPSKLPLGIRPYSTGIDSSQDSSRKDTVPPPLDEQQAIASLFENNSVNKHKEIDSDKLLVLLTPEKVSTPATFSNNSKMVTQREFQTGVINSLELQPNSLNQATAQQQQNQMKIGGHQQFSNLQQTEQNILKTEVSGDENNHSYLQQQQEQVRITGEFGQLNTENETTVLSQSIGLPLKALMSGIAKDSSQVSGDIVIPSDMGKHSGLKAAQIKANVRIPGKQQQQQQKQLQSMRNSQASQELYSMMSKGTERVQKSDISSTERTKLSQEKIIHVKSTGRHNAAAAAAANKDLPVLKMNPNQFISDKNSPMILSKKKVENVAYTALNNNNNNNGKSDFRSSADAFGSKRQQDTVFNQQKNQEIHEEVKRGEAQSSFSQKIQKNKNDKLVNNKQQNMQQLKIIHANVDDYLGSVQNTTNAQQQQLPQQPNSSNDYFQATSGGFKQSKIISQQGKNNNSNNLQLSQPHFTQMQQKQQQLPYYQGQVSVHESNNLLQPNNTSAAVVGNAGDFRPRQSSQSIERPPIMRDSGQITQMSQKTATTFNNNMTSVYNSTIMRYGQRHGSESNNQSISNSSLPGLNKLSMLDNKLSVLNEEEGTGPSTSKNLLEQELQQENDNSLDGQLYQRQLDNIIEQATEMYGKKYSQEKAKAHGASNNNNYSQLGRSRQNNIKLRSTKASENNKYGADPVEQNVDVIQPQGAASYTNATNSNHVNTALLRSQKNQIEIITPNQLRQKQLQNNLDVNSGSPTPQGEKLMHRFDNLDVKLVEQNTSSHQRQVQKEYAFVQNNTGQTKQRVETANSTVLKKEQTFELSGEKIQGMLSQQKFTQEKVQQSSHHPYGEKKSASMNKSEALIDQSIQDLNNKLSMDQDDQNSTDTVKQQNYNGNTMLSASMGQASQQIYSIDQESSTIEAIQFPSARLLEPVVKQVKGLTNSNAKSSKQKHNLTQQSKANLKFMPTSNDATVKKQGEGDQESYRQKQQNFKPSLAGVQIRRQRNHNINNMTMNQTDQSQLSRNIPHHKMLKTSNQVDIQGAQASSSTDKIVAQRIVKIQPVIQMRQMIDSLCMKEKDYIYSNPNFRDDCIGTQNTIFDLSGSHLVNRPGVLSQQEREAKSNIRQQSKDATFSGQSFLAGQKLQLNQVAPKRPMAEIKMKNKRQFN